MTTAKFPSMITAFFACILVMAPSNARSAVIPAEEVSAAVADTLASYAAAAGYDVEVVLPAVANISVPGVDTPALTVNIDPEQAVTRRMEVAVRVKNAAGGIERELTVFARLKFLLKVACLTGEVERYAPIRDEDVEMRVMEVLSLDDYFTSREMLAGMRAKRRLPEGTALMSHQVEAVPLVKRGDRVAIHATVGNVAVNTYGTAREDGGRDQEIRVYSEFSKSTITCEVVDENSVVALF